MLSNLIIEKHVRAALEEDLGHGHDITSNLLIPAGERAKAAFVAREDGVLAGLIVALSTFSLIDPDFDMVIHAQDGDEIKAGFTIAEIEGPARSLHISNYYRKRLMNGQATAEEKEFIKRKIASAQWLIESIEQRRSTLMKVAQEIIDYQKDYFEVF